MGTGVANLFMVKITGDSEEQKEVPVNSRIYSSSNITVTVGGLEPDSTYKFEVAAENDIGLGPFSEVSDEITTGKGHEHATSSCTETLWLLHVHATNPSRNTLLKLHTSINSYHANIICVESLL